MTDRTGQDRTVQDSTGQNQYRSISCTGVQDRTGSHYDHSTGAPQSVSEAYRSGIHVIMDLVRTYVVFGIWPP